MLNVHSCYDTNEVMFKNLHTYAFQRINIGCPYLLCPSIILVCCVRIRVLGETSVLLAVGESELRQVTG